MVVIGLQAAPAVSAANVSEKQVTDKFMVKYPGGGQNGDAATYKVYKYSLNHFYIHTYYYNYNKKTKKYYRNGGSDWMDLKKITANKIRILSPPMEGKPYVDIVYTKHSVTWYYWNVLRAQLKKG